MRILPAGASDWPFFGQLASAEGWRVPHGELALYDDPSLGAGFVLMDRGRALGFVTVSYHQRSGWIGNLLVKPEVRGRGYGRRLFVHALEMLRQRQLEWLWLTASEQGRGLYEKFGFVSVDTVERWGRQAAGRLSDVSGTPVSASEIIELDSRAWQERRDALLQRLASSGLCFRVGETAAMVQQAGAFKVLGPWLSQSGCPRENRQLLASVLASLTPGTELVTDLLASSPVRSLLAAVGFSCFGKTRLMVCGEAPPELAGLTALASLGSMG